MRYSGIAWTGTGYEVAVLDEDGRPAAPPARFDAGPVAAVTGHLLRLQREFAAAGESLLTVIDSTNGVLDGGLIGAGLAVCRADPWVLPPRSGFGSVPAEELALAAVRDPAAVFRLSAATGTLGGRDTQPAGDPDALAQLHRAGRCLSAGDRRRPVVALTFDDGPHPPYTGRILDVLDRYAVPATFFCVGLHALAHPAELERIAAAGHQIANHSWSHPYLPDLSPGELLAQLARTDEAIDTVVGTAAGAAGRAGHGRRMFRPPYGSHTPDMLRRLTESGDTVVLWDVEASDWTLPGTEAITRALLDRSRPGSVILLHDGGGDRSQTAEALPGVIEGLLARGYGFARVDAMPRA
ncbi:polysaccharide deacetylase family protein [Kitasatospora sp. NPDC059646]|uniref:polysaccharide deacetylase family protein n=1 Tax=Kitasatospora sp. NPDC059646 TaxID=3346893 RepID=UPI0036A2D67E